MRAFIAASPVALFSVAPDGRVLTWNASAERIFGWSADEVVGKPLPIVPPDKQGEFRHIRGEVAQTGAVQTREVVRQRKDGSLVECHLSAAPIHDENGQVVALIAAIEDVTERNEAMRRLAESENRFKHVFESANVGKSITSLDGVIEPNRALAQMLGYSRDELRRKTWRDITPQESIAWIEEKLAPLVSGEIDETRFVKSYLHRDGSTVWADVSVTLRRSTQGRPLYYITTIVDITERMRAREQSEQLTTQLQQAQRLESVGRLAGGVAHDFNNILSVILGYAELLVDGSEDSHPHREAMNAILDGALRARDLTRQLLAFSRKQVLEFRTVDVNEIVRGIEPLLRRVVGEDVELHVSLSNEPPTISADARQIEQVLMNLAINARDALSGGGILAVETGCVTLDEATASERPGGRAGEFARLSVSDTGCGMDPETLDRIFEPFFTTKSIEKGTGLGLATSYGIVKQHGGNIWVESEPGDGTTFEIYLPRIDADPDTTEEVATPTARATEREGKVRVLVVEDDEAVRNLTVRILRQEGYRVIESHSAADAVRHAVASTEPIDVVLTDVVMPDMTGPAVYESVRERHPRARALYMSGYADEVLAQRGLVAGDIRFLQKPFTMRKLLESVARAVDDGPS
jgi:two-component system sensor histidine kinase EvgS